MKKNPSPRRCGRRNWGEEAKGPVPEGQGVQSMAPPGQGDRLEGVQSLGRDSGLINRLGPACAGGVRFPRPPLILYHASPHEARLRVPSLLALPLSIERPARLPPFPLR